MKLSLLYLRKKLGFLQSLQFGRSSYIEICASLERIYWALDQIFYVGGSLEKTNPSLDQNQKTTENQRTRNLQKLKSRKQVLKGEDLESPETKWINQLASVKFIS